MTKSSLTIQDILSLVLNGVALPGAYGGNLYLSLHTADPGSSGDQTVNEISYTGYARVAIVRDNSGTGWTISGNPRTNVGELTFGTRSDVGSATITHGALGTASSGAGRLLYKGAVASNLIVTQNVTPRLVVGALQLTEA